MSIAARLEAEAKAEAEAKPGGLCISDDVMRQVRGRLDLESSDGGERVLENIAQPIHIWHWGAEGTTTDASRDKLSLPLSLPDKPSIAVLPFDNGHVETRLGNVQKA